MLNSMKLATSPYTHGKVPLPQMRQQTQLVRNGRRGPSTTMPMRADKLPVQADGGRHYRATLRRASAGCDPACRGHENPQMFDCCKGLTSDAYHDRRHSQSNWIEGERNGIARSDPYGARTIGTCFCPERTSGGEYLEADDDCKGFIERTPQGSR